MGSLQEEVLEMEGEYKRIWNGREGLDLTSHKEEKVNLGWLGRRFIKRVPKEGKLCLCYKRLNGIH